MDYEVCNCFGILGSHPRKQCHPNYNDMCVCGHTHHYHMDSGAWRCKWNPDPNKNCGCKIYYPYDLTFIGKIKIRIKESMKWIKWV